MSIVDQPRVGLEYYPCRYGRSRVSFRGPKRRLDRPYVAFWGGTATYGRYIREPFAAQTEKRLKMACVNFGVVNAGLDVFLSDPEIVMAGENARFVVFEALCAQNMSNRFYTVHPRRNDRFIKASRALRTLYPDLDFAEHHFTGHLLRTLQTACPERFEEVAEELRIAWVARIKHLCGLLPNKILLVWMADRRPNAVSQLEDGPVPSFVTEAMIREVSPFLLGTAEVVASKLAQEQGTKGMVVPEFEAATARRLLGPRAHDEAGIALAQRLKTHL